MMIPIRCFSCGKPIAHLWEEFKKRTDNGEDMRAILDEMELVRHCCRAALMGNVELIDNAAVFKKA